MSIAQELERYRADHQYAEQHRQELRERYPDRWVAIYHQQVVGVAEDAEQLREILRRQGIPPGEVYREFLTTEEVDLIVPVVAS